MKHAIPEFRSDGEAEAFVETADLDRYDLSGFKTARLAVAGRLNVPLPQALVERTEEHARLRGIPLTRFVQDALERAMQGVGQEDIAVTSTLVGILSQESAADRSVLLNAAQRALLAILYERRGQVLTRDVLLAAVAPNEWTSSVEVTINSIRRKLARVGLAGLIKTVWGRGYILSLPVEGGTSASQPKPR